MDLDELIDTLRTYGLTFKIWEKKKSGTSLALKYSIKCCFD